MKKLLLACLTLTLVLCLLPTTAEAATEGNFTYTISNGKATITNCYWEASGDITIPSTLGGCPVTSIGGSVFSGGAFYNCTGLTSVTIPDSVTSIGEHAFSGCTGLTSVTIPDSVTYIGSGAFQGCTGLTGVYITDLAAWCAIDFAGFSSNPLYYAKNLYLNGSLVTELTIPDSVTTISYYAFENCTGLTAVTIPDSVTTIGGSAFYGCTGLTAVTIPDSVTSIGGAAFEGCDGLTAVTIGDSVTTIGNAAFYGCTGLTSVTIGDRVTTIEGYAFSGCTALEEITIPVSLFSIADDAFKDVPLKTVHYGGTKEQWKDIDLNNNAVFSTVELKTTEKPADPAPGAPADPSEPTDPSTPTEPSTPAPTEPSAPGNPTEPEKANHTICLVAIIALSLALAGSITLNLLQHKKKKA